MAGRNSIGESFLIAASLCQEWLHSGILAFRAVVKGTGALPESRGNKRGKELSVECLKLK